MFMYVDVLLWMNLHSMKWMNLCWVNSTVTVWDSCLLLGAGLLSRQLAEQSPGWPIGKTVSQKHACDGGHKYSVHIRYCSEYFLFLHVCPSTGIWLSHIALSGLASKRQAGFGFVPYVSHPSGVKLRHLLKIRSSGKQAQLHENIDISHWITSDDNHQPKKIWCRHWPAVSVALWLRWDKFTRTTESYGGKGMAQPLSQETNVSWQAFIAFLGTLHWGGPHLLCTGSP